MDRGWLAASTFFVVLSYIGRAVRWQVMLRPLKPASSFWNVFVATTIGFTAVVLLGRAGELVRPYLISVKERVPFPSQVAAWLLERIYDLLIVLALFGFALTRYTGTESALGPGLRWVFQMGGYVVGGICSICLILLFFVGQYPDLMRRRLNDGLGFLPDRYKSKISGLVTSFLEGTVSTRSAGAVTRLVVYTLLEWLIIVGCFLCVFRAFPATARLGVIDALILVGFIAFGSAVQIPGIGGGMQVATVVVLTELFGIDVAIATGMAVVLWVVTFVLVVPAGVLLSLREGISWKRFKDIQ